MLIYIVGKAGHGDFNLVCPRFTRETEGGRSFSVSTTRFWNLQYNFPILVFHSKVGTYLFMYIIII